MEGILYLMPEDEIESLDTREGANRVPPVYRRFDITVTVDGLQLPAFSYEVVSKAEQEIAPSQSYVDTIMQGTDALSIGYVERLTKHINTLRNN